MNKLLLTEEDYVRLLWDHDGKLDWEDIAKAQHAKILKELKRVTKGYHPTDLAQNIAELITKMERNKVAFTPRLQYCSEGVLGELAGVPHIGRYKKMTGRL